MRRIIALAILAMTLSVTVIAQATDTSKSKVSENKKIIDTLVFKLYGAENGKQAEAIASEILKNIDTNPIWQSEKSKREIYRIHPLYVYLETEDFNGFKDFLARLGEVKGTERIHFATAGYVRRVVAKGIDLDYAAELIQKERQWARKVMLDTFTSETFNGRDNGRMYAYALFTMDYARLLDRKGEKQYAFDLMKEAMEYNRRERKSPEIINYYLSLAAEFNNTASLKTEMEVLVKEGMATAEIIDRLKSIYKQEKGNDAGFEKYIASLGTVNVKEKMEGLKKMMVSEMAPEFRLKDLRGKEVKLKDLKGKTIILDFWATWCGPCVAAFPAMQTLVNRYKDDANVQFLFINTLEQGNNKEERVKEFMDKSKYNFQVLMDNQSEAAKLFDVKSIPAKFVIDKNGVLRFRATGFDNDAELMDEIEAMIQLVK